MNKRITLIVIGMMVGILSVFQSRSYDGVKNLITRDVNQQDVLNTIHTLKVASERLKKDISSLETQLEQYQGQTSAYGTLVAEIEKNEFLVGIKPISGEGFQLILSVELDVESMVDLMNELWAAGAEAIAINGHRITDQNNGFYHLNDLMIMDGDILYLPQVIDVIGNREIIEKIVRQPNGILTRLENQYPKNIFELKSMGKITISVPEE